MQESAWTHATQWVQERAALMLTMSTHRQESMETEARFPFSLADGIVLVQCVGLTQAASIVGSVDPRRYPDEEMPAAVAVKGYLQGAVDKATQEGKHFHRLTAESLTAYLLSPLLLPRGERPPLVCTGDAKRKGRAIPAAPAASPLLPNAPKF